MTWKETVTSQADASNEKLQALMEYLHAEEDDIRNVFFAARFAYDYIANAVGAYDEDSATAEGLLFSVAQYVYDNRSWEEDSKGSWDRRVDYLWRSTILQLQLEHTEASE